MKKLILAALFLLPTSLLAQDMWGPEAPSAQIQKLYPKLYRVLMLDDTNRQPYIMGQFTCNEFSLRLYFQRSERVATEMIDLPGFELDTKVPFQNDGSDEKLPLFYVNMSHHEAGFYHAINAMLVKPDRPDLVSSYVFIEPQTDQVMLTPQEVYAHYAHYYRKFPGTALDVTISDIASFKFNGHIYQSFTNPRQRFLFTK